MARTKGKRSKRQEKPPPPAPPPDEEMAEEEVSDRDSDYEDIDDFEFAFHKKRRVSKSLNTKLGRHLSHRFLGKSNHNEGNLAYSTRKIDANLYFKKVLQPERALRSKNVALAQALNQELHEKRILSEQFQELKHENLNLIEERASLRERIETLEKALEGSGCQLPSESEVHAKISQCIHPIKTYMHNMLLNLTEAIECVSKVDRNSQSLANSELRNSSLSQLSYVERGDHSFTEQDPRGETPTNSLKVSRKKANGKKNIAHVSPRVSGHAIHNPQIEIQRLNANDILRHVRVRHRDVAASSSEHPLEEPEEDRNVDVNEEDEESNQQAALRNNRQLARQRRNFLSMEVIEEAREDSLGESRFSRNSSRDHGSVEDEPRSPVRRRTLQRSPVVKLIDISRRNPDVLNSLQCSTPKDRVTPSSLEKSIIVLPPSVWEKLVPSERRKSSPNSFKRRSSNDPSPIPKRLKDQQVDHAQPSNSRRFFSDPVNSSMPVEDRRSDQGQQMSETPTCRESNEEFLERLMGDDPMEGPSWLFGDANPNKNRRDRGQSLAKDIEERKKRSSSVRLRYDLGERSKRLDFSALPEKAQKKSKELESRKNPSSEVSYQNNSTDAECQQSRISQENCVSDRETSSTVRDDNYEIQQNQTQNEEESGSTHSCEHCSKVFRSGRGLNQHRKRTHGKEKHVNDDATISSQNTNRKSVHWGKVFRNSNEIAQESGEISSSSTTNDSSQSHSIPQQPERSEGRPRRQAAQSIRSFKEPNLNKKMRREDGRGKRSNRPKGKKKV